MSRERQEAAATNLENLLPQMVETIKLLRDVTSGDLAYALVYELRTRLGYVVRTLGESVPMALKEAREVLDAQIQLSD